jgi:hypothetical protein
MSGRSADEQVTTFWRRAVEVRDFLFRLPVWLVLGPFILLNALPRRPPNLSRLTRSAAFRALDATAAAWSGEHFSRIEEAAPWLHRTGDHVIDFCTCALEGAQGLAGLWPPPRWATNARRETTVIYGFNGDLADRLDAFADALALAGWGTNSAPPQALPTSWWLSHSAVRAYWQPIGEFSCPPALERVWEPDRRRWVSVQLSMGWADGSAPEVHASLGPDMTWRPADLTVASPLYQPVTLTGGDIAAIVEAALLGREYEHQLAIRVELDYIPSAGFSRRIPKSMRPVYQHRHW